MDTLKRVIHPIHKEGYPFILVFGLVTLIFSTFSSTLAWIGVILTTWCVYFFRDPARIIPQQAGLVVSPGDGVVSKIEKAKPPRELEIGDREMLRVSIFLNVFNVHVNRVPVGGKIERLYYNPGKFLNASLDKASEDNERQSVWLKTEDGRDIAFVQIAGLVARRIVCTLENNQQVETGQKFGIIRFGSRVDVYLPEGVEPLVGEGQIAVGGETILADLNSAQNKRIVKKI